MASATRIATPSRHPSTRSSADDVRTIPQALRSEWIKLSSLRSAKRIIAFTIAVNLFTAWAVAMWVTDEVLVVSRVFVYPANFTAVLAAVAGTLMFTAEIQHGTLATALTTQPARWVLALSKATTACLVGLVLGALGMVAGAIGAIAVGLPLGDTSGVPGRALAALAFAALAATIGLGIGMIVRSSAGAISGLLVWWFVAENILVRVVPAELGRFLPFDAGFRLLQIGGAYDTPEILAAQFDRAQLAIIFGLYAAAALGVGTILLYRRDNG